MDKYGKYKKFNEYVNSVVKSFVLGHEIEASLALYYGDIVSYEEELKEWMGKPSVSEVDKLAVILDCYSNRGRFERLDRAVRQAKVIPFVGAGVSIPCGMKGWRAFLEDYVTSFVAGYDDVMDSLDSGRFEDAVDLIVKQRGVGVFEDIYKHTYAKDEDGIVLSRGGAAYISKVFHCVVTTNFDRVIEYSYKNDGHYVSVFTGLSSDGFWGKFNEGQRALVKVHGDCLDSTRRVLTKEEYDTHYGSPTDKDRQLSAFLGSLYTKAPLLFVGCSLATDRTMDVFRLFKEEAVTRKQEIPYHVALLEDCSPQLRVEREKDLVEIYGINPIWFPRGAFVSIEIILKNLMERS